MAAGAYKLSLCLTAPLSLLRPHRRPLSLLRLLRHRHSPITLPPPPPLSAALHPHLRSIHNSFTKKSLPPPKSSQQFHSQTANSLGDNDPVVPASHPWPEWSQFIDSLFAGGGYEFASEEGQSFGLVCEGLSDEFVRAASACLCFARDRPDILGLISRREIEVLIENGKPFLFKNAIDTERRMRSFLANRGSNVFGPDEAETVDLMKYILSYASNPTISPERNNSHSSQATESSVRYLLREIADLSSRVPTSAREQFHISGRSEEASKSFGQNIQMKRGDWICPKCQFMNFARNTKCIECEELRPKRQLTGGEWDCPQCGFFNYGRNLVCLKCECRRPGEGLAIESRFSQLNLTSGLNNAAGGDGFPRSERGSNFVVNPRKTPLERQLVNSQYQNGLLNNVTPESNDSQYRGTKTSISHGLDHILGSTSANSGADTGSRPPIANSGSPQYGNSKRGDPNYVPFVPLPADMFAKKPQNSTNEVKEDLKSFGKPKVEGNEQIKEKDQEEKAERWFKKVAELHDVKDLASAISDEDFPEIMPMRKGENRFVVSKKKDRSLTSPTYKRQAAMEQGSNTDFVPFVPFPPDYFAKKDKQQTDSSDSTTKSADGAFSSHVNLVQGTQNQQISSPDKLNSGSSIESRGQNSETATSRYSRPQSSNSNDSNTNSGVQATSNTPNFFDTSPTSGNQSVKSGWTGKSLEGSAVTEPDPLDMSEEAKAERWFRRVAQIKDISELSQIPDEDFPSIMPMRKGVNRFVVSKRKTPLERRLTSPQYRKNLPVVSSNPIKKESDSS